MGFNSKRKNGRSYMWNYPLL